jgi:glutathione peroxidase
MTLRQQILKWVYPFFVNFKNSAGENKILYAGENIVPKISFYNLSATLNNGQELPFENLKNKMVLIVNTASNCGYTRQYEELQKLYDQCKVKVIILAFPSNDFKEQEKGNDEEIAAFCQVNFGVSFPLAKKAIVVKTPKQNKVYEWLTNKELNGWNDQQPTWNFSKYLINEKGQLSHYFDPAISPLSEYVIRAIKSGLNNT